MEEISLEEKDGMVEVEFECAKCGRLVYEWWPEDTDFDKLHTMFEHDFDCSELDDLEEDF